MNGSELVVQTCSGNWVCLLRRSKRQTYPSSVSVALDQASYNVHAYLPLGSRLPVISFPFQLIASKQVCPYYTALGRLATHCYTITSFNYASLDLPYRVAKTSHHALRDFRALHLPNPVSTHDSGPITLFAPTSLYQRAK